MMRSMRLAFLNSPESFASRQRSTKVKQITYSRGFRWERNFEMVYIRNLPLFNNTSILIMRFLSITTTDVQFLRVNKGSLFIFSAPYVPKLESPHTGAFVLLSFPQSFDVYLLNCCCLHNPIHRFSIVLTLISEFGLLLSLDSNQQQLHMLLAEVEAL
ncbi:hypothetical protein EGR_04763 [Echinococcus granulosus]|uniref:Uncharacterized protein n=1 Tax=Echinococcus granulosus TaxID=6210 RepID=W6UH66_ECHGR|nr:hypothetical protein EGR_04763 [Echinococcus granulosus]EUB60381.1 hypothetical protein EGR_04763 [Echinococcus granulosus]